MASLGVFFFKHCSKLTQTHVALLILVLVDCFTRKPLHCPNIHHEVAVVFYEIMILITSDALIYEQGNEKRGNVIV